MRTLLDTHAFLWWVTDSERLSGIAHSVIADESNDIVVSAASAWEISTKFRLGKLPEADAAAFDIAGIIVSQGFEELAINVTEAERAGRLPGPPPGPVRPNAHRSGIGPRLGSRVDRCDVRPLRRQSAVVTKEFFPDVVAADV